MVDLWTAKRAHEKSSNQKLRIIRIRQLAIYLCKQDVDAYIPEAKKTPINHLDFTPYIFSREEMGKILQAADTLTPDRRTPMRHLVMPEVFRLLYCCGMRISEVLHLTVADVDLTAGILTVHQGKFNIDRLVPLAPSMTARLQKYQALLDQTDPPVFFFRRHAEGLIARRLFTTSSDPCYDSAVFHMEAEERGRGYTIFDMLSLYTG